MLQPLRPLTAEAMTDLSPDVKVDDVYFEAEGGIIRNLVVEIYPQSFERFPQLDLELGARVIQR